MRNIPADMMPGVTHETNHCGTLTIVAYAGAEAVTVTFDDPKYETTTTSFNIRKGQVKNRLAPSVYGVGFLGVGPHKSKRNGVQTDSYKCWISMLERCYCERRLEIYPCYQDCSVSPEWHNFQVFAEWYENNYPKDGGKYDLDKDIKVAGNRIYSPEFCMFVTERENQAERNVRVCSKSGKFLSPDGELYEVLNIRAFCREHGLHQSYMSQIASGKRYQYKGWKAA